jgi:HEAT repeat protein
MKLWHLALFALVAGGVMWGTMKLFEDDIQPDEEQLQREMAVVNDLLEMGERLQRQSSSPQSPAVPAGPLGDLINTNDPASARAMAKLLCEQAVKHPPSGGIIRSDSLLRQMQRDLTHSPNTLLNEALVGVVNDTQQDHAARLAAAEVLQQRGDDRYLPAMVRLYCRSLGESHRPMTMQLIAQAPPEQAISAIEPLFRNGSMEQRLKAISLLGKFPQPESLDLLTEGLTDPERTIRKRSMSSLFQIGQPAIEPTGPLLEHERREVRLSAIQLLALIGGPQARSTLRKVINHPDSETAELARTMVQQMQQPDAK